MRIWDLDNDPNSGLYRTRSLESLRPNSPGPYQYESTNQPNRYASTQPTQSFTFDTQSTAFPAAVSYTPNTQQIYSPFKSQTFQGRLAPVVAGSQPFGPQGPIPVIAGSQPFGPPQGPNPVIAGSQPFGPPQGPNPVIAGSQPFGPPQGPNPVIAGSQPFGPSPGPQFIPGPAPGPPKPQPGQYPGPESQIPGLPPLPNIFTRETDKLRYRNRNLAIAITITVVLLLGALAALFTVIFGFNAIGKPGRERTRLQFEVTRVDLSYSTELQDPNSYHFANMAVVFCDMIKNTYLKSSFPVKDCSSSKFEPPDVTATIRISIVNLDDDSDDVFAQVASTLVATSDADLNTNRISANTIKLL